MGAAVEFERQGRELEILEGSSEDSGGRLKSSLRLQYEAQVRVIQQQVGSLEKARENLGLSQRKICQLLLVDPSAWTRWTKPGGEAPPHIWRALQWYLTLREKIPGLTPQYFLGADPRTQTERTLQRIDQEKAARERQIDDLKRKIVDLEGAQIEILLLKGKTRQLQRWNLVWSTAAFLMTAFAAWTLFG